MTEPGRCRLGLERRAFQPSEMMLALPSVLLEPCFEGEGIHTDGSPPPLRPPMLAAARCHSATGSIPVGIKSLPPYPKILAEHIRGKSGNIDACGAAAGGKATRDARPRGQV